jgi:chromosome segregation ATPase
MSEFIPWLGNNESPKTPTDPVKELQHVKDKAKRLEEKLEAKSAKLRETRLMAKEDIAGLEKKAASLERVLAEATKREEEANAQVASMREKRDALKKEKEALRKELTEADDRNQKLDATAARLKKEKKALGEEKKVVADELEALRTKLPASNKKQKQLETDNARLKEEIATLKKTNAELTKKNSSILAAIKKMEAERDAAMDSSKQTSTDLTEQKRSNKALRSELQKLQLYKEKYLQQGVSRRWPHQRLWTGMVRFCMAIFPAKSK